MRKKLGPMLVPFLLPALVLFCGCGDSNVNKAKELQSEKDFEGAIHYYNLALEKNPANQIARYGLVEAHAQKIIDQPADQITPEEVETVMADLRPVAQPLMSDPNIKRYISLVYQMIAKRYAEEGRDDKAAEAWAEVIEIEPTFAEAHFNLGLALSITGRYEEAIPEFEKAVNLNPYFVKGYHAMGDALLNLKRYEEAKKQYLKALELNPDDPVVHDNLGRAYFESGDTDKAIAEFRKTIEIEPNYSYAYKSLHDAYQKIGDKKNLNEIDKEWKERTEAYLQTLRQKGVRLEEGPPKRLEKAETKTDS